MKVGIKDEFESKDWFNNDHNYAGSRGGCLIYKWLVERINVHWNDGLGYVERLAHREGVNYGNK
ncbi:hypothetical protein [Lactiplantibacillus plantarum]|uniref:hypothetical protein n=1 Tax=Lactiplantibacillus plantarum TaxID=1590 RepID=UPI00226EF0E8|nr:hypothetical protein [Lactiplantibacillus plantarum]